MPANDTPNGSHSRTIGGTWLRMFGGAAATSRYDAAASSGHSIPLKKDTSHAKYIFGSVVSGTNTAAASAMPSTNSALRCSPGSRSRASGTPNSVPGCEPGIARARLSSGPGRSCWGAANAPAGGGG